MRAVMTPQDSHPIIDLLVTLGRILSAPLGELLRWLLQRRLAQQPPRPRAAESSQASEAAAGRVRPHLIRWGSRFAAAMLSLSSNSQDNVVVRRPTRRWIKQSRS